MAIKMLITDAGLAEVVNAEQSGTAPVVLSHIAFGTGQYTPTADMTALKSEFKRFDSIKGGAIADNVIHISLHDNDKQAYTVYEVGVFTESGTLFAVSSQTTPIVQKAEDAEVMLVTDFVLSDIDVDSITIGDTNFILNPATTETAGLVELATEAEAKAGNDETKAITPATLDTVIEAHDNIVHKSGNEKIAGSKTFTGNLIVSKDSPFVLVSQNDIVKGTTPSASQYMGVSFTDSEGHATTNRLGLVETKYMADGGTCLSLSAYKPEKGSTASAGIEIIYPATGSAYVNAPTPAAGDNSTKIATTAFVNTKAGSYLPLAGGTMSGNITFSENDGVAFASGGIIRKSGTDNTDLTIMTKNSDWKSTYVSLKDSRFDLGAGNGTDIKWLSGNADGTITWNGKNLVRSINGRGADSAGNIDVGGMHIGMVFPHPAATPPTGAYLLNGQTITNCRELYPDFWEWVNNSGVRSIGNNTFEAEVAEYGICNGFVLWEQSGSVRLPLWNGYQTPLGDSVPVVGNGENINIRTTGNDYTIFTTTGTYARTLLANNSLGDGDIKLTTDPTKSGIVADTSNYKQDGFYWCIQVFNAATELSEQVSAQLASQMQAKAQTDLANVSANIDFVVESYTNGSNWYRVYKSGWIEQGGVTGALGNNTSNTINFLKPYANTNYSVFAQPIKGSANEVGGNCPSSFINNNNGSNFILDAGSYNGQAGNVTYCWRACGQGA